MGRVREMETKMISLHFSATIFFVMSNSPYRVTKVTSKRSKSRRVSRAATCCTEARRLWWQRGLVDAKLKIYSTLSHSA